MAFPVTLNGRTYTLTDFEGTNYVDGLPDAFEDFVTHAGDIYNSTSTTSNSIGTGSKTFTVEANKPYQAGTPLRIADAAAPSTNFLDTVVTSYSGTTLVVNSIGYGGSGTKTSWTVNIGGAKTIDGTLGLSQGGTGATDAAGARTNIDVYSKSEADTRYLNISGDSADISFGANMSFGDNNKILMGAGSDLQIYHDGASGQSIIHENGPSVLKIRATDFRISNADNTADYLSANNGAEVSIRYNGAVKLATTATGAQIQSTADQNLDLLTTGSNADNRINFGDSDDADIGRIYYQHNGNHMLFYTNAQERVKISGAGDVGINTNSPTALLSVSDEIYLSSASTVGGKITLNSENTTSWLGTREMVAFESVGNGADHRTGTLSLKLKKGASDTTLTEYMQINAVSNYTTFSTGGSERIRVTNNGLTFNGDTAAANALNDYEFGFFEPTFASNGTNPSGITYDPTVGNEGRYTKIGGLVHIQINIRTDAVSNKGSGNLRISGLPFTAGSYSGQGGYSTFSCSAAAYLNNQPSAAQISEGGTYLELLYRPTSDDDVQSVATSSLNTGSNDNLTRISGTYMTEE